MAEGISLEELQLAARNHGMPLEALRYPVTPVGLHYLLIHFDVPDVDPDHWRLTVRGERELTLDLAELRQRPRAELAVTMECAGNGRARLDPRPVSQPWLLEAVGTALWGGTPLRPLLEETGVGESAEFLSRDRSADAGEHVIQGRAWSGLAPIAAVNVSTDGGSTWAPAELEPEESRWAWRGWRFRWQAEPGEHVLCSRARDEEGNEQPVDPPWNLGGYANNAVQTVSVTVV